MTWPAAIVRLLRWRPSLWLTAALLLAAAVVALGCLREWELPRFVAVFVAQLALYGIAAWRLAGVQRTAPPHALGAIVLVAMMLRCIALFAPQALSTDAFRYVWDGRVQAAGINPYRYIPADPALRQLRDPVIYPNINRAAYAHTIYPPAAEAAFLAITRVSSSIAGMKLAMLAFDGLSIAYLIALLRRHSMPPTRVLLYAWHPLPIWEFAGTGHVDAMAIALLLGALLLAARGARGWTGMALGAAALVKFYPLVVVPALYRRWDWRMPAALIATALLLYLPYLGVGSAVIGFLPGYAAEEGLQSGNGFFLWSLLQTVLPLPAAGLRYYLPFAALVMALAACWVQSGRASGPGGAQLSGGLLLAGVFTLLVSPHNPWYFAWLIPFLCFRLSPAHLWLTGACVLIYVLPYPLGVAAQAVLYVPFLLLLMVQWYVGRDLKSPEIFDANRTQTPTV